MRRWFTCVIVLLAVAARAEPPAFDHATVVDQMLAVDAGRAYVTSYLRLHEDVPAKHFDWSGFVSEGVTLKQGSIEGYIGVFFPAAAGSGCGFAIFSSHGPGHLIPEEWGYSASLAGAVRRFEQIPTLGYVPIDGY